MDMETLLRRLAEVFREEAEFLGEIKSLPEPDLEIRTRQMFSYYRLSSALERLSDRMGATT